MRLSEWRSSAPVRDALGPKVLAVVEPVLATLGAERDPDAWVAWGEDPGIRYQILVATVSGLVWISIRANVPGEGPRATAKLIRWSRVQIGELSIETQGAHRMISFQVEGIALRGADDVADRIGAFALVLFASIDGRTPPEPVDAKVRRARARATPTTPGRRTPVTPATPARPPRRKPAA